MKRPPKALCEEHLPPPPPVNIRVEVRKGDLTTEWVCGSSAYSTMKPFAKRDSGWDPGKSWATTPCTKLTAPRR